MQFTPLHDRVVVRRIEGEEKTKGGLITPDTAKEKPSEGEVVAVGEGARKDRGRGDQRAACEHGSLPAQVGNMVPPFVMPVVVRASGPTPWLPRGGKGERPPPTGTGP